MSPSGTISTLTPTLSAGSFSDPDAGDTHAAGQWQIIRTSDSATVFDSGTDTTHKTSITVPSGNLAYSTDYTWGVRYQDNHGAWSNWGFATITTSAAPNTKPNQPTSLSPSGTISTLTPTLSAGSFSDPDAGDTHAAGQWQIIRTSDRRNRVRQRDGHDP